MCKIFYTPLRSFTQSKLFNINIEGNEVKPKNQSFLTRNLDLYSYFIYLSHLLIQ